MGIFERSKFTVFKGVSFATLSGIFFCLTAVLVKDIKNLYPGQLNLYRYFGILVFTLPNAVRSRENFFGPSKVRWIIFIRGVCGASQTYLGYLAFRYLPLGEASAIIFSIPATVTIAARIFLKESCSVLQIASVIFTFIGIIFIAKVPAYLAGSTVVYTSEFIFGLIFALGSLFFNTAQIVILRRLKTVHPAVILFNMAWIAIIENVILTAIFGFFKWNLCGLQSLYCFLIGVLSCTAQTFVTIALQCESASTVSTLRSGGDILMSFLWQTFFFKETPDAYSIIGAVLIGFSFVLIGTNKGIVDLPKDSPKRSYLKYFMFSL